MEASSWQEVFFAFQCLLSVGLSDPAACQKKKKTSINQLILFQKVTLKIHLHHNWMGSVISLNIFTFIQQFLKIITW